MFSSKGIRGETMVDEFQVNYSEKSPFPLLVDYVVFLCFVISKRTRRLVVVSSCSLAVFSFTLFYHCICSIQDVYSNWQFLLVLLKWAILIKRGLICQKQMESQLYSLCFLTSTELSRNTVFAQWYGNSLVEVYGTP